MPKTMDPLLLVLSILGYWAITSGTLEVQVQSIPWILNPGNSTWRRRKTAAGPYSKLLATAAKAVAQYS